MKWVRGRTRNVLLVGRYAVKFPIFSSYRKFLYSLLGNHFEWHHRKVSKEFQAPIWFYIPGGLLLVMARCEPLDVEAEASEIIMFDLLKKALAQGEEGFLDIVEISTENYGYYQGRWVAFDYGHGGNLKLVKYYVEADIKAERVVVPVGESQ